MAVIALASAGGSPGVTTTSLGLALAWPRPVLLVDADPTGTAGVLSGFFRGTWAPELSLIDLALSPLGVADALPTVAQRLEGTSVSIVAGIRDHAQATGLRDLWAPLAEALADLESTGQDVIVDGGRLGLPGYPEPLLDAADLTLMVTRSPLPALAAARTWSATVRRQDSGWRNPGALLIGEGQPYKAADVARVIGLPVIGVLPDEPEAAAVYYRGAHAPARFENGTYVRSLIALTEVVQAAVSRARNQLIEEVAR